MERSYDEFSFILLLSLILFYSIFLLAKLALKTSGFLEHSYVTRIRTNQNQLVNIY